MSVFRPIRRVTAPDGGLWEIYAYKVRYVPGEGRRLRRLVHLVREALRSLRSDQWTIQAMCFIPRETYTWRTTREHKGQVLAHVEGLVASGDMRTSIRHATFVGLEAAALGQRRFGD